MDEPKILTSDRNWSKSLDNVAVTAGELIKSKRIFGVEIECLPAQEPLEAYQSTIGKKCVAVVAHQFKDIGVGLDGGGVEWKTPRLAGVTGEKYIIALCDLLAEQHYTLGDSCGLHIHLDGGNDFMVKKSSVADEKNFALKNLMSFYATFEDVIQSFLPRSRRYTNWCSPLKNQFSHNQIYNMETQLDIEKIWYGTKSESAVEHYKGRVKGGQRPGINFSSLFSENHIEIRYHTGTINARKILEWVNLHQVIMDKAAANTLSIGSFRDPSLEEKTDWFFSNLRLSDDSVKYFLARQDLFKVKVDRLAYNKEEMMKIIKSDKEVLA